MCPATVYTGGIIIIPLRINRGTAAVSLSCMRSVAVWPVLITDMCDAFEGPLAVHADIEMDHRSAPLWGGRCRPRVVTGATTPACGARPATVLPRPASRSVEWLQRRRPHDSGLTDQQC